MAAIPLDTMLWVSLGVFGLGVLALIPMWHRGNRRRRGEFLPIDETDVRQRNLAGGLLVFGTVSALVAVLMMARDVMSFGGFMVLCGIGTAIILAICFRVDAVRARRHR